MSDDENHVTNDDGSNADIRVSSKSRFAKDHQNKPHIKQEQLILEVYIERFPLKLYNQMTAYMKKHGILGGFGKFCLKLIDDQFDVLEQVDIVTEARAQQPQPEAKPDGS